MSVSVLTLIHVVISMIGIFTGFVVLYGMLHSQRMPGPTAWFLVTTILTSATGFLFPFNGVTPAFAFSVLSLIILAVTLTALYARHLAGAWRWIYVVTAIFALYLNVFVLVVQFFLKFPALHALAPQGKEPPFAVTQGLVLVLFLWLGAKAVKQFRPATS